MSSPRIALYIRIWDHQLEPEGQFFEVFVEADETLAGLREEISNQLHPDEVPENYYFQYYQETIQNNVRISKRQEGQRALNLPMLTLKEIRQTNQDPAPINPGSAPDVEALGESGNVDNVGSADRTESASQHNEVIELLEDSDSEPGQCPSAETNNAAAAATTNPVAAPSSSSPQIAAAAAAAVQQPPTQQARPLWLFENETKEEDSVGEARPTARRTRRRRDYNGVSRIKGEGSHNQVTPERAPGPNRALKRRSRDRGETAPEVCKSSTNRLQSTMGRKRARRAVPEEFDLTELDSDSDSDSDAVDQGTAATRDDFHQFDNQTAKQESTEEELHAPVAAGSAEAEEDIAREEIVAPSTASAGLPERAQEDNTFDGNRSTNDPVSTTENTQASPMAANEADETSTGEGVAGGVTPEVKQEILKKKRVDTYRKYADRYLLMRQSPDGVARLGGSGQETYPYPRKMHPNIWDAENQCLKEDYPFPKFLDNLGCDDDMRPFSYAAYNSLWNINAPKYAGQPFAAVTAVPPYHKGTGDPFPVFVNRKRLKANVQDAPLLGWEYVGNYRIAAPGDQDGTFWESSRNYSKASKSLICQKIWKSAQSEDGYGRRRLTYWKEKLLNAIWTDSSPAAPLHMIEGREPTENEKREKIPPLAARARALRFTEQTATNMSDRALLEILVNIDEFHGQEAIVFVEYDERIYDYCKGGRTNHDRMGRLCKNRQQEPAKASDWYDYAEEKMLM